MSEEDGTYRQYLGDGVYASYDGYHIVLSLDQQPDSPPVIALEPSTLFNLDTYREYIAAIKWKARKAMPTGMSVEDE